MLTRRIEQTHLPVCRDARISVMGYSVLALGLLSGRISADRVFAGDDQRRDDPRFSTDNRARIDRLMETIRPIAVGHNASLAQIVIAWTLGQPGLTFALCGARNPEQAKENAKAGTLHLSGPEIDEITRAVTTNLSVESA